jgi:hypothetical protein
MISSLNWLLNPHVCLVPLFVAIAFYLGSTTIEKIMGIKPGPKRIADSTGKPDRRQRDNKNTPGNKPSLKPHKHKKGD